MSEVAPVTTTVSELVLIRVARDLAMDLHPLETILKTHDLDAKQWEALERNPRFRAILRSEIEAWNSASNTAERVKLKSLSFVEEALPEFYARAHDPRETLSAKIEVLKTIGRFAGVGVSSTDTAMVGEKFSVTINLGNSDAIKIEKSNSPVIEGETV